MSAPYTWTEIARTDPVFATRWMFSAGGTSDEQVPEGMQTPLTVSQIDPLAQSAVESQRRRGWQKPAELHISAGPQLESAAQRQAPVAGSQTNPALHCVSLEQRFGPLEQAAQRSSEMSIWRVMGR